MTLARRASNTFNRASRASTRSPNCLPRRATPQGHGENTATKHLDEPRVCGTGVST